MIYKSIARSSTFITSRAMCSAPSGPIVKFLPQGTTNYYFMLAVEIDVNSISMQIWSWALHGEYWVSGKGFSQQKRCCRLFPLITVSHRLSGAWKTRCSDGEMKHPIQSTRTTNGASMDRIFVRLCRDAAILDSMGNAVTILPLLSWIAMSNCNNSAGLSPHHGTYAILTCHALMNCKSKRAFWNVVVHLQ